MSDFKDRSIINNMIYVTFVSMISIQNTWLIYIFGLVYIQLGVFSSQVFQESSRHTMWRRKHCNFLLLFTSIFWRFFLSFWWVHAVLLLTCSIFVFWPSMKLHYMAWRKIVMLKFQLGFHAYHHQNMVYTSSMALRRIYI
jgi:hypothetical protein